MELAGRRLGSVLELPLRDSIQGSYRADFELRLAHPSSLGARVINTD